MTTVTKPRILCHEWDGATCLTCTPPCKLCRHCNKWHKSQDMKKGCPTLLKAFLPVGK